MKKEEYIDQYVLKGYHVYCKIPKPFLAYEFDDLKGNKEYQRTVGFIRSWKYKDPPMITLLGSWGIGKTHLAVASLKKYYSWYVRKFLRPEFNVYSEGDVFDYDARGGDFTSSIFDGAFTNYNALYSKIKKGFADGVDIEARTIERLSKLPFLIVDDMFHSVDTDFAVRIMFELIEQRVVENEKPTIITTNKTVEELEDLDGGLLSRLFSGVVIELKGDDYRLINSKSKYKI